MNLYIGGIVGYSGYSVSTSLTLKNCANYGGIVFNQGNVTGIGGIVGYSSNANLIVRNCLNAGGISPLGSPSFSFDQLSIGGIVGFSRSGTLNACVNIAPLSVPPSQNVIIGGICGYTMYTNIVECFCLKSDLYSMAGDMSYVAESYNFTESLVLEGTEISLITRLNEIADPEQSNFYSHWISNPNSRQITFNIYDGDGFSVFGKIVLMPEFLGESQKWFNGWFTDNAYENPFSSAEVTEDTTLYGQIKECPVYFYARGVLVDSTSSHYMGEITLLGAEAVPQRDDCEFKYWADKDGNAYTPGDLYTVLSENVTFFAAFLCEKIRTAEDLVDIALFVNLEESVVANITLENDIDFDGCDRAFVPIDKETHYFDGSFDGKGHTISNFNSDPSIRYVGVFGYSLGITIKNVVIDSSCSFVGSCDTTFLYIGSIIARCKSTYAPCVVENVVNMANVAFGGSTTRNSYIGGIIGHISMADHPCSVKNCVNYGSATHTGTGGNWASVSGIAGSSTGGSTSFVSIQNCLNYGALTYNGVSDGHSISYISGVSWYTTFENCVGLGAILSSKESECIGAILEWRVMITLSPTASGQTKLIISMLMAAILQV